MLVAATVEDAQIPGQTKEEVELLKSEAGRSEMPASAASAGRLDQPLQDVQRSRLYTVA